MKVSIVLLNWNGDQHVHRCLQHVLNQTYPRLEIIIVDNGSTDGSLDRIRAEHPSLHFIENGMNVGFAAGMNRGIEAATGEFVIPLNQDVCMHEAFIEECVTRISKDDSIGAIGGRVFSWVGDSLTQDIRKGEGEYFVLRKRFQGDPGHFASDEAWTWGVTGSFPFFRKAMLDDVRTTSGYYYDESYVTGWEDIDLFFRLHLRGWKCLFFPRAYGWHVGSGSVGGNATFLTKQLDYQTRILRNRYFAILKNLPLRTLVTLSPYLILAELSIPAYLLIKSPKSILGLVSSWRQVWRALPELLDKRRRIMEASRVPPNYLTQFFQRF